MSVGPVSCLKWKTVHKKSRVIIVEDSLFIIVEDKLLSLQA